MNFSPFSKAFIKIRNDLTAQKNFLKEGIRHFRLRPKQHNLEGEKMAN